MFSINSLNGNSFYDISLKYRQMQIKELGDESFNAPSELRTNEVASLSTSGDSSFSKFLGSFNKLHSLITAYVFKTDSNISTSGTGVSDLKTKIDGVNIKRANDVMIKTHQSRKDFFQLFGNELDSHIQFFFEDIPNLKISDMNDSIIDFINSKIDTDSSSEIVIAFNMAVELLTSHIQKQTAIRANFKGKKDLIDLSHRLEEIENKHFEIVVSSFEDENYDAVLDSEKSLYKSQEQDRARGVIGELTSLNDGVLIASDLYDSLSKNYGSWNSLISNGGIILKKGDIQKYKIKEDSAEMVEILTKDKYVKEDQKVFKKILKLVSMLDELIQQFGNSAGVVGSTGAHQFIGNSSYPTRSTPSTGFNTVFELGPATPVPDYKHDDDDDDDDDDDYDDDDDDDDDDDNDSHDSLNDSDDDDSYASSDGSYDSDDDGLKYVIPDSKFIDRYLKSLSSDEIVSAINDTMPPDLIKDAGLSKLLDPVDKPTKEEMINKLNRFFNDDSEETSYFEKYIVDQFGSQQPWVPSRPPPPSRSAPKPPSRPAPVPPPKKATLSPSEKFDLTPHGVNIIEINHYLQNPSNTRSAVIHLFAQLLEQIGIVIISKGNPTKKKIVESIVEHVLTAPEDADKYATIIRGSGGWVV